MVQNFTQYYTLKQLTDILTAINCYKINFFISYVQKNFPVFGFLNLEIFF